MSVTSLLLCRDVVERLKPLRPPPPRKLAVPIKVVAKSARRSMIGTAFDYILRFEIQRRAPHAADERWVAQHGALMVGPDAIAAVETVRATYQQYIRTPNPSTAERAEIARCAIRLARFDPVFRAFAVDKSMFDDPDPADVEELLELLRIVPFEEFFDNPILLNPTFGAASSLARGADVDLIAGDFMVDIKVTSKGSVSARWLDQMLCYFLLARLHRSADPSFPEIRRAGLYFARHAHLCEWPVSVWTENSAFAALVPWFSERCKLGGGRATRRG